jgi:hypothetical protein
MFDRLDNYFDEEARVTLKEGVAAWHRLTQHEDWNGWLRVGKAIATAQDIAASVTGQTSGKSFNAFMASCYNKPTYLGEFATINKGERSLAAKCWRNREAIEKWRANIGQTQALRMNHPAVVWKNYEAAHRPPAERVAAASPFAAQKAENAQLQQQLEVAKEEMDRAGETESISLSFRASAADILKVLRGAPWDDQKRKHIAMGLLEQATAKGRAKLSAPEDKTNEMERTLNKMARGLNDQLAAEAKAPRVVSRGVKR